MLDPLFADLIHILHRKGMMVLRRQFSVFWIIRMVNKNFRFIEKKIAIVSEHATGATPRKRR